MSNHTETCEFCKQYVTCITLNYDSYCNIYGCKINDKHNHKLCKSCEKDHQEALEWFKDPNQNPSPTLNVKKKFKKFKKIKK